VQRSSHEGGRATGVTGVVTGGYGPGAGAPAASRLDLGSSRYSPADHVVSSMALSSLLLAMDPPAPEEVRAAARGLRYRDFLTVALVVPVAAAEVERGFVVRMPKAYPMYDDSYAANVGVMRDWLAANAPNVHPVGRNGMHKYNNQDHSMYTAMLTVENISDDAGHDVWEVNVEADYHEEKPASQATGLPAPAVVDLTQGTREPAA